MSDVTKAEIVWLLKTVDNGFSVRSNDEINEVFSVMFPDSKIASQFRMVRSKAMYEINHGLAPYFKTVLNDTLNVSDIHVYSFDESLNDVAQTSEMDLYLRYWAINDNHVKVVIMDPVSLVMQLIRISWPTLLMLLRNKNSQNYIKYQWTVQM